MHNNFSVQFKISNFLSHIERVRWNAVSVMQILSCRLHRGGCLIVWVDFVTGYLDRVPGSILLSRLVLVVIVPNTLELIKFKIDDQYWQIFATNFDHQRSWGAEHPTFIPSMNAPPPITWNLFRLAIDIIRLNISGSQVCTYYHLVGIYRKLL